MQDQLKDIDYSLVDKPFVIASQSLSSWPSFHWTLTDWSRICQQTLFPFRVHRRDSVDFWENEAIARFDTYLKYYNQWRTSDVCNCDDENPFKKYPKSEFWVYSSYNHMKERLAEIPEVIQSVNWTQCGLGSRLDSDAKNSTLWIGSEGAFTPCHQDSYGYNFVAQLSGKKQWILFPPTDTNNLYPTRIPYEESSVFSSVDFRTPDLRVYPLLQRTTPHVVELSAGDILFVPHLWWHFVRVTEEDSDKSCISINTWIYNDCYESSLKESIVRLLTTSLFTTLKSNSSKWLNAGADLFTPEEALHSIDLMLRKGIHELWSGRNKAYEQQILPKSARIIHPTSFEQLGLNQSPQLKKHKSDDCGDCGRLSTTMRSEMSPKTIVDCILHPEVIELISKKLIDVSIKKFNK